MVMSVKGSEFTGWKVHLNASEYSSDRYVLLTSLKVFFCIEHRCLLHSGDQVEEDELD